jgi:hypothetical protein
LQVIRLSAEADEFDRDAGFLLDRHHHVAFARAEVQERAPAAIAERDDKLSFPALQVAAMDAK